MVFLGRNKILGQEIFPEPRLEDSVQHLGFPEGSVDQDAFVVDLVVEAARGVVVPTVVACECPVCRDGASGDLAQDDFDKFRVVCRTTGETEPDAVPEVPEVAVSVRGEVYQLGEHRLMCGDSTDVSDTAKLMGKDKAILYLVDPPYNVALQGSNGLTIQNDDMSDADFRKFLNNAFKCASGVLEPGAVFYIFHSDSESANFRLAAKENDLEVHETLYWIKNSFVLGRFDYHYASESALYGWKPGAAHAWYSDRCQTNLLHYDKPKCNDVHPSMKPVEMLVYLIQNSTRHGEIVLDNFGGSGSTLIACEQTGRVCRMMELDEHYCDVIRRRWAEFKYGEGCDWKRMTPAIQSEITEQE